MIHLLFNPYPTMTGFFGPDTFYRAKKSILLSAIYFKNKVQIRPFYLEFS